MTNEIWKSIPEYYGIYEISNHGRVRSVRTFPHILSSTKHCHCKSLKYKNHYKQVRLCKNGVKKYFYIHRLVAAAFIGPCPPGKEVNHKDLFKGNNHDWNLEYRTHGSNIRHAARRGRFDNRFTERGECHHFAKLTNKDVAKIIALYKTGRYRQIDIANQYGITQVRVSQLVLGKHNFKETE